MFWWLKTKKNNNKKTKQVVLDKGIGKTKNLNYMISLKIFMFTPPGRTGGLELRGGYSVYRCTCLLRSCGSFSGFPMYLSSK